MSYLTNFRTKPRRHSLAIMSIFFILFLSLLYNLKGIRYAVSMTQLSDQNTFAAGSQDAIALLSGSYTGTIAINEPLALGVLDISFTLTNTNGTLTGVLNDSGTLAYPSAAGLQGSITGRIDGITPTFRIETKLPFTSVVSGREVARSLRIDGSAYEDGNVIMGAYTETISGFTPQPLIVNGMFLASRPAPLSASSVPGVTPVTPVPTPTNTNATPGSTPTLLPGSQKRVYLPLVTNKKATTGNTNVEIESRASETPTPASTQTPLSATSMNESITNEQPAQSPEATATSENNIYLPSITR